MLSNENILYYAFCIIVLCVVIFLIRKIACCLIKSVITILVICFMPGGIARKIPEAVRWIRQGRGKGRATAE